MAFNCSQTLGIHKCYLYKVGIIQKCGHYFQKVELLSLKKKQTCTWHNSNKCINKKTAVMLSWK